MKRYTLSRIFILIFGFLLIFGAVSIHVAADNGPPTPEEVFDGHNFDENYWDINVFNNSKWDHPEVDPMISWLNNTWNIKWIREGNFEMGMLSFIDKKHVEGGKNVTYTTPAQMWWQHAYLNGSEILIASMHCAWFGFDDNSPANDLYDDGEYINPFFYMGMNSNEMETKVGLYSSPKTTSIPLQRIVDGSKIIYTWGYNYSDIIFYVPSMNHTGHSFDCGFNYSDPGSYIDGSCVVGNQTYIFYEYILTINTEAGNATMHQNYEAGKIGAMFRNNSGTWQRMYDGEPNYMPDDWAMCLGTWSFIMAGQDYDLEDLEEGDINATVHKTGLTTVKTTLGGAHAFDFAFSQKPQYDLTDINDTATNTYDVLYECLSIDDDNEFIEFVSGMLPLVGDFGRLIVSYAINQTNNYTNGIPFEDAWDAFDATNTAAFFITCYPQYGESGGGHLIHDPVFNAYFTPPATGDGFRGEIPGYPIGVFTAVIIVGIVVLFMSKKRINSDT